MSRAIEVNVFFMIVFFMIVFFMIVFFMIVFFMIVFFMIVFFMIVFTYERFSIYNDTSQMPRKKGYLALKPPPHPPDLPYSSSARH
jgi:hypothetical protein